MNSPCIHVEPLPNEQHGAWVAVRAAIAGHPHRWRRRDRRNGTVYFEVPDRLAAWTPLQGAADDRHDIWLRAAIFPAMESGRDLVIHGNVSAALLANIEVYQRIICDWWPNRYRVVDVSADRELTDAPSAAPAEAVLAFSGGLDSIHALYCHQHRLRGRNSRRIPLCVFVHGYDIPVMDDAFQGAFQRAERVVTSLGSELVPVRTNLRTLLPPWPESYPTALAAVLSLFGRRFSEGLVASAANYRNACAYEGGYGSSAVSDWLLSSHDFRITHDVADATRVQKTEVLHHCETARAELRVCWAGADLSTNCGCCSKCLWQMLCMRAVGLTDFRAFQQALCPDRVAAMRIPSRYHWLDLQACWEHARQAGRGRLAEFEALRRVLLASPYATVHAKVELAAAPARGAASRLGTSQAACPA